MADQFHAVVDQEHLSFMRFLAESLSTLNFKRQEEPMTVIYHLNRIMAVSGLQVMHLLEPQEGLLATDLHVSIVPRCGFHT